MTATARDAAKWMRDRLKQRKALDQVEAVHEIERIFGRRFIYQNNNGNPAISRQVLREFRALTEGEVVWSRSDQQWRFRARGDGPGRMID